MANQKFKELKGIENEFEKRVTEKMRSEVMTKMSSRMISILARRLIKDSGYSVATTILQREFRAMGKSNAREFIDIFKLEKNSYRDASKALKVAALFLGLKLDTIENETIIKDCPQGNEAIKFKEPLLCNVCLEYNRGILEEMLGEDVTLERTKWIFNGDGCCMFKPRKK